MSHYTRCLNCGEPECMDSDTGVHRRDDGTVCPDPRDAVIEGLRAEVARLTAERDEAIAAADATIDVTPGERLASVVRRVCEESDRTQIELDRATLSASKAHGARKEAEAEVERLRANAIPEDAEEIVFKELSIGVFEPQDLEIQEAIHAKRRAKARAVVKALRGNA